MSNLLVGLDIGTTSAKGILLRPDGHVVAEAHSAPYPLAQPQRGWCEQEPENWWQAACSVMNQLCRQAGGSERIAGIAVSGQGCACTLIDEQGNVLRRAIIWMDTRAGQETDLLARQHAEDILRLNGNAAGAYNLEPKLLWLRNREPEIYQRARYTLTTTAYIVYRLTGQVVMNRADGGIFFAYDSATGDWSRPFLEKLGLRPELYPPLASCTEVIGKVTTQAACACGLSAGIPVVAGGEDSPAAALSVGVSEPGDAFLSLGTAAVVGICHKAESGLKEPRLLTYPHVLPGYMITSGSMSSAGAAVEWLLREFGQSYEHDASPYGGLNRAIETSEPGAGGVIFLPYLSGELHPILNADARGVFFGLSLSTTRADMARAVVEGSALAVRHNLDVAREAGATVKRLYASGGPTRSAAWCQIITSITGVPVTVVESGGAPAGDALLAGAGTGLIDDAGARARRMVSCKREYLPQASQRERYDHMYEAYVRIVTHLLTDFTFMAASP
jgi:xylulokinase